MVEEDGLSSNSEQVIEASDSDLGEDRTCERAAATDGLHGYYYMGWDDLIRAAARRSTSSHDPTFEQRRQTGSCDDASLSLHNFSRYPAIVALVFFFKGELC